MAELIDVTVPATDQEGTESSLGTWFKQPGEKVLLNEPLLELNTDKVVIEVAAPAAGILLEILKQQDEPVQPGEVLGRIEASLESAAGVQNLEKPKKEAVDRPREEERVQKTPSETRLSPAVRRALKENSLEPSDIEGSGRGGRITHQDVSRFLKARAAAPAAPGVSKVASGSASRMVPHSPMRKNIARHMVESLLHTAPHVTTVFEADFSAVLEDRGRRRAELEKKGVKLTFTAYLVQAAARALKAVPEINSRWHESALEIFDHCNIGVAAAMGKSGLLVPVIERAEDLSLSGIASRLQELTEKARQGRLESREMENGTFTITNHGVTGSLLATPIIHQPQSAILGVGKVEKRLKIVEENGRDSMQIRPMAYLTLTIDHRALDGFTANLFMSELVGAIENWLD